MDEAHRLAEQGAADGTAVIAGRMTGGRGSRGRAWLAPPGGLWLSLVRRPSAEPVTGVLALRVGLQLCRLIERLAPGTIPLIKWPNDLMVGERKFGGILCEMKWQGNVPGWLVIGVGLNVSNSLPPELQDTATTLAAWLPDITPQSLEGPVIDCLRSVAVDRPELNHQELAAFVRYDWLAGRQLARPGGARAAGVEADGRLRIRDVAGEVTMVTSASSIELPHR